MKTSKVAHNTTHAVQTSLQRKIHMHVKHQCSLPEAVVYRMNMSIPNGCIGQVCLGNFPLVLFIDGVFLFPVLVLQLH